MKRCLWGHFVNFLPADVSMIHVAGDGERDLLISTQTFLQDMFVAEPGKVLLEQFFHGVIAHSMQGTITVQKEMVLFSVKTRRPCIISLHLYCWA